MLTPNGTFDVSFDATPSAANIDSLTGLSAAPALTYTDLAVIARFNLSGSIDAINGSAYAAANPVPYAAGATYHFRAAVNVPNHSYSLYVTPPGKPETPVALNYAFRTGQTGVTALSNWAVTATTGSHQTCDLVLTNPNDMTAPSAPTGLAKTSSTQTSLSLSWAAATDNVGIAGYTVYVNGTASSAASGTSRTISGLSCGSTYTIGVDAYDAAGNHSAQTSATMSTTACPADTTPPSTPASLQQSGSTATSVTIAWTASTDNVGVTGYTLYVNGTQVGPTTGTSATATGLTCGTAYTVAVDAFDAAGNHSAQASISASTAACSGDTTSPSTPTGLATSAVGQTSITLSWTASSDNVGVTGYRLYLAGSQVGTALSTSYAFSGLTCGTSYTLGVAAVDAAGNVSGTATISATTAVCSGSGGNFSGTFDCYGSTPNCTGLSPKTCNTTISAASLQSTLNSATGGEVICVNTGSTGNISLSSKSYSALVTVQPASTAAVTLGNVTLTSVRRLNFTGVGNSSGTAATMTMNQLWISGNTSTNLTFDHITYSSPHGCVSVNGQSTDSAILFDHDRLDNMETEGNFGCLNEGRLGTSGMGAAVGWVTVTNSHFSGNSLPGCSDGVQVGGDGVVIGPGNEFTGIMQGSCIAHSDPIQFYKPDSSNNVVTGNWFHNNSTGCMCWDGGDNNTFTNNVFESIGYWSIVSGDFSGSGENGWLIAHNVFGDDVTMDNGHSAPNGTGNVLRDNVWTPGNSVTDDGSGVSYDHNLNCVRNGVKCPGTGNISGTQVFVASPSSGYYHYELAPSSPGYHAASDGKSMGIAP
jgi:chitodextrinase